LEQFERDVGEVLEREVFLNEHFKEKKKILIMNNYYKY
jgi:hypothetical protein